MKPPFRKKISALLEQTTDRQRREETSDEEGGIGGGVAQVSAMHAWAECWRGEGGEGKGDRTVSGKVVRGKFLYSRSKNRGRNK